MDTAKGPLLETMINQSTRELPSISKYNPVSSDSDSEGLLTPFKLVPRQSTVDREVQAVGEAERNWVEPVEDDWCPSPREQEIYHQEVDNLQRTNGAAEPMWIQAGIGLPSRQPTFQQASTAEQDQEVLQEVRDRHVKNREMMSRKYNQKWTVDEFKKRDVIVLKISRAVRTSTDNLRLFCVVVDRPHRNSYELRCRHGLLSRLYATKNLERVPDDVAATIEIPSVDKKISLTRAAQLESTSTRVLISCQCRGQCGKRCRCIKQKVECSPVHCHREEHDCGNLAPPTDERTNPLSTPVQAGQITASQVPVIQTSVLENLGSGNQPKRVKRQRANTTGDAIMGDTITVRARRL